MQTNLNYLLQYLDSSPTWRSKENHVHGIVYALIACKALYRHMDLGFPTL